VTRIPGRLLDLARAADATPGDVRPGAAAGVADVILRRLPQEAPGNVLRRRAELVHGAQAGAARPDLLTT
jgi:hypothetical protein